MAYSLERMADLLVKNGAIKSKALETAFRSVPREKFFRHDMQEFAFEDSAFPLCDGSTISQPSTIAVMLELLDLEEGQKVLEIGSGSGYVLALISKITKRKVFGIDVNKSLVEISKGTLKGLEIDAKVGAGDGKKGMKEEAPFDRILISAAVDEIPAELFGQLAGDGKIVAPVGDFSQNITVFNSEKKKLFEIGSFVFVRLK
ncbi:MAG: methyltransferase domain-containing protein [Candidatus Diapherotrites archaeon]|nr:methyltransferase domain-containing protein [Candidatus Diapherotrites archaeon]